MKTAIKIAVSGAAGQIAYSLLFRIANGNLLGSDQPIHLSLLDITPSLPALKGVTMELQDCAFPLLHSITTSDDPYKAFENAEIIFLVGARPRAKGMERRDLLEANGQIFSTQGKAISDSANPHVKILVVGNPANTNALILINNAPKINPSQVTAMMRLDHNRALSQLAQKTNVQVKDISQMIVWGNHSPTMFPDLQKTQILDRPALPMINDDKWYKENFIPTVAQRGTAIIEARGASSAASAASSAIDHMRDWYLGHPGQWVSMAIMGSNPYGIPDDLVCGMPCICEKGQYAIVPNLSISDKFTQDRFELFIKELSDERDAVRHLFNK